MLASGSDDRTVRLWDFPSLRLLRTLSDHERAVQGLAFSANGRWLASASQDKTVKVWEVSDGRVAHTFADKVGLIAVALSPDGHWLASSAVRTVNLWDVPADHKVHVLEHDDYVNALAFSPDGRFLASGSDDETAKVWDVKTGQRVGDTLRHDDAVTHLVFSPDGKFIASGSYDRTVKIWSTSSWRTLETLRVQEEVVSLGFDSTGGLLMSVTGSGRVELWEAPTWRKAFAAMADQHGSATNWAFSLDGRKRSRWHQRRPGQNTIVATLNQADIAESGTWTLPRTPTQNYLICTGIISAGWSEGNETSGYSTSSTLPGRCE
jgi:WD40 repeat protein